MDKTFLKDRKVKIALTAIGVLILIYLLTGSWVSNIRHTEKVINSNWVSLKQIYEQRLQLLPQFAQIIQYYAPQAQDLQQTLVKAYERARQVPISDKILTDQTLMQEVMARQMEVANALAAMAMQVNQYPTVVQNRQFLMLNMQLQALEQQIEYFAAILNQNVMIYNGFLIGFPKNWLNSMFLKAKQMQVLPIPTVKRALTRKI